MPKTNQAPLYDKGFIQIHAITLGDTPNFEIYDGRADRRNPIRITTRQRQVGIDFSPEDIAALLRGENLESPIERAEGEKPLTRVVYSTGVTSSPKTGANGKKYTNNYLNIRSALVNKNADGKIVSYSFTHPEDRGLRGDAAKDRRTVSVYATTGGRENPIPVSPAQANLLLDGESIEVEGRGTLRASGIEPNDHGYLELKVKVDWAQRDRNVRFAGDDEAEGTQPVPAPRPASRQKATATV